MIFVRYQLCRVPFPVIAKNTSHQVSLLVDVDVAMLLKLITSNVYKPNTETPFQ